MSDVSRVEEIFLAALKQTEPDQRAKYLDAACVGDLDLRRQVEELLVAQPKLGRFLEPDQRNAPDNALAATMPLESTAAVGDRVGPYKLLERIGEGGMGEVWVADQQEPIKRRVALKLIKPGMDSRSVLARFEAERQALAVMDHPNIAKVLDAGTTKDGRPYFVMELVKGTPITEFADARKITTKERLELFVPVCQAIQHAHMKGIIHRDIKPSNVLVELHDDRMVAKVIDFGVAKAIGQQLTEKTLYTGFGALVGTPAYMAPEQATFNAMDIDTRADVYALGVLLYELLAGSPPIEKERLKQAALDEVLRIVRDEEPPRPSQRLSTSHSKASIAAVRGSEPAHLSQLMKGEIDWIVMKALEKDRTRRYESANGLAKDVQRYLNGDAVEACPPTLGYRVRKAYRRNKSAARVAATFLCFVLFAVGMWVYILQQKNARQAATEQTVNALLSKATLLRGQAKAAPVGDLTKWTEAIDAAQQAEASLQTGEPSNVLRQRVTELIQTLQNEQRESEKGSKLLAKIDAIRINFVEADAYWSGKWQYEKAVVADEAYATAFREFGVDLDKVDPEDSGRILRQNPQPLQIAFAIDNWALLRKYHTKFAEGKGLKDAKDWKYIRLIEVAKVIDDDPWRCAIRATIDADNRQVILKLLENDDQISKQSARALYVLAHMLDQQQFNYLNGAYSKGDYSPISLVMLKRAWQLSPGDFQICWTLSQNCPEDIDARSFALAAVAAAPESEFAQHWMQTTDESLESEPILSELKLVKKGTDAPEWKFPHVVIESCLGERVFIGPTRYPALKDNEKKKLERDVQELRWSIRLQPTVTALQTQLAKRLIRLGRIDEALAVYESITKVRGKLDPYETIAEDLYGMGQIEKAKEMLEAVIQQSEKTYLNEIYALLGVIHTEQGRPDLAFDCFRDAYIRIYAQEDGNSNMTALGGGWDVAMQCSGTIEQVVAAYQSWIGNVEGFFASRLSKELGEYLTKHGKHEEALAVYRQAQTRHGGNNLLYELSRLLVQLDRPDEAISVYKDAIDKKPDDIDLRHEQAKLYGEIGRSAERIAELNLMVSLYLEKIETETQSSELHGSLGEVYRSLGKSDEARKHYREHIKYCGNHTQLNSLAMDFAANFAPIDRDFELAVEAATRACELTGYGDSNVLDTLATAYAEKGDFDAAVKWQLKAIEILDDERLREGLENNLKLFREKTTVPPRK